MRIVYLSPVGVLGGAERCLLNCIDAMHRALPAAQLHLLAGADGPLLHRAAAAGAKVQLLSMPPQMAQLGDSILHRGHNAIALSRLAMRMAEALPATRQYICNLRHTVARINPHLVHSNGLKSHLLAHMASVAPGKVVWHLHDFIATRPAMNKALRWAGKSSAGIIAISQAIAEDARAVLPGVDVEVVYNAIDVQRFCPGPAAGPTLEELAGLPAIAPGTLRVGLVATYARWKGHENFMRAAALLKANEPELPVKFYIIGGPIYHTQGSQYSLTELRRKAAELGVVDRFGFVGFQAHTEDIYRALDVVVHASTSPEPFGLTIVEAMACGRAVVVARAGGAAELFAHNRDAVGVPPGRPDALAAAIAELLHDPERRQLLGLRARQTAVNHFSRDRLEGEILQAYRKLIEGKGERRKAKGEREIQDITGNPGLALAGQTAEETAG